MRDDKAQFNFTALGPRSVSKFFNNSIAGSIVKGRFRRLFEGRIREIAVVPGYFFSSAFSCLSKSPAAFWGIWISTPVDSSVISKFEA